MTTSIEYQEKSIEKILLQVLDFIGIVCRIPLRNLSIDGDSVRGFAAVFVPQVQKSSGSRNAEAQGHT
jgi:hypothetical protein